MRNKKLIVTLIVVCSVALLAVLSSVIFSVQNVTAYCLNAEDDEALAREVIAGSGIKKGKSIFSLNKDKVTEAVNSNVDNVKVINIEKKFPNTVSINYVKVIPYLRIEKSGKYYFCGNDGKILFISDEKEPTSQEALDKGYNGHIIELRLGKPIGDVDVRDKFADADSDELIITVELMSALERLGIYGEAVEIIDFIDLSKSQYIFVGMKEGVVFELQGANNLTEKFRAAYSFYSSADQERRSKGTFIVPDGDGRNGQYSPENKYSVITGKE